MRRVVLLLGVLCMLCAPLIAGAHEVYVLSPEKISEALSTPSPSPFDAFATNQFQFFLWGFIAFVMVSTIFFASITHRFELFFAPYLARLRPYALPVARYAVAIALLESAYNNALFGPELALYDFGSYAFVVRALLVIAGVCLLVKRFAPIGAAIAALIYAAAVVFYGSYMLTYLTFAGGCILLLLAGNRSLEAYGFLALRVCFGASIAFSALYAKFVHSNLALATVMDYNLTAYFHFEPLFIVLGACIIEVLLGIFFIMGFEVRHASLFYLFWLTLSLFYFGEAVWPHIVVAGVATSLFMYGYDRLTIEGRLFNRGKLQPFL